MELIIFTDLDGTLLDLDTYSFKKAKPALKLIKKENKKEKNIAVVPCTSKTAEETKFYLKKLKIKEPFIVENGGAIYIPKGYFSTHFEYQREEDGYLVIELGTYYPKLIGALKEIKEQMPDSAIVGFGDMKLEELVSDSNLPRKQAELAKIRGYDEPFKFKGDEDKLRELVEQKHLHLTKGGRYFHIIGNNDKGKAIRILSELFEKEYKTSIRTIALGDADTDLPMFDEVNQGYMVKVGPEDWNNIIQKEVKNYSTSREHGEALLQEHRGS